jgi:hypothetical protein
MSMNITTNSYHYNNGGSESLTATLAMPTMIDGIGGKLKPKRGEQLPLDNLLNPSGGESDTVSSGGGYSQSIVGYINVPVVATNIVEPKKLLHDHLFGRSQAGVTVNYDKLFSADWLESISSNSNLTQLVECLQLPMLGIRIFSKKTAERSPEDADFIAPPPSDLSARPIIAYDTLMHGVMVNWRIEYPSSEWRQSVRMGTVQDLDSATLCLYVANLPTFVGNDFKPLSVRLRFGKSTVSVHKFTRQSTEVFAVGFEPAEPLYPSNVMTNLAASERQYLTNRFKPRVEKFNRAVVFQTVLPPPSYDPIVLSPDKSANIQTWPKHPASKLPPPPTGGDDTTGAARSLGNALTN